MSETREERIAQFNKLLIEAADCLRESGEGPDIECAKDRIFEARDIALQELRSASQDTERLDWLESNSPISLERVLDLRRDKENTVTRWVLEQHAERFGGPVRHPPLREAIDAARKEKGD